MAQRPSIIDVSRSMVIGDPNSFPANLVKTQQEDNPEKPLPILAYEGYNILPTAYGYRSYFGTASELDTIAVITGQVDKIISFQLATYQNELLALCSDGIWRYDSVATTWEQIEVLTDHFSTDVYDEWTHCVIENKLYMYRAGEPVIYTYSSAGTLAEITPSFLNMTGQMGIFRARGRLAMWDSANSISWSAADDFTDFTPSIEKMVGNVIFSAIIGRIVTIKPQGDGFIVYCTKSIVGVSYDSTGSMIWAAQSMKDSTGITTANDVTQGQTGEEHFVRTNTGFYTIGAYNSINRSRKMEPILPELWDILKENNLPVKLDCIQDRFLILSTADDTYVNGKVGFLSQTIPDFTQTLLQGGFYNQGGGGALPEYLDPGLIISYLNEIYSGGYAKRQGTKYRVPRWQVTLDTIPTAFYCHWDKDQPGETRRKWDDVSAISTSVGALPADETKFATAAAALIADSGHDVLTGEVVLTPVRPNRQYPDTVVHAILGKVYCHDTHYVQETIWDNVKEHNKELMDIWTGLDSHEVQDTYINSNPNPEEPLDGIEEVLGVLPDGFGPIRLVENEARTSIIHRKHFMSGWELTQTTEQADVVELVEDVAEPEAPAAPVLEDTRLLTPWNFDSGWQLFAYNEATGVQWFFVDDGYWANKRHIWKSTGPGAALTLVLTIDLQADYATDPIFGKRPDEAGSSSECYPLFIEATLTGFKMYGMLGIPSGLGVSPYSYYKAWEVIYSELDGFSERIGTAEIFSPAWAFTPPEASMLHAYGDGWYYYSADYNQMVYFDTVALTLDSKNHLGQEMGVPPYLPYGTANFTILGDTAYKAVRNSGITGQCKIHKSEDFFVTWSSFNVTADVAILSQNAGLGYIWTDGTYLYVDYINAFGILKADVVALTMSPVSLTMGYIVLIGQAYIAGGRLYQHSFIEDEMSADANIYLHSFALSTAPAAQYRHTRMTRYYPTYNNLSDIEGGISELKMEITHTDYCLKKPNGDVVIQLSVPVTAAAPAGWDNTYPLYIENGRDVWEYENSSGPNPINLYDGTYTGWLFGEYYQSQVQYIAGSDPYWETFHLAGELTITYPGATFLLQEGVPAPLYPTYVGAYVYDMHLKKWGKMAGEHKMLVNFNPVNNTQDGVVAYTDFGMKAGILGTGKEVKLFDAQPDDSYIRFGKIGYSRLGYTVCQEIKANFRYPPNCVMYVDASLDGLGTEPALARDYILTKPDHTEYYDKAARWFTISLHGTFDLQLLEFRGSNNGRR